VQLTFLQAEMPLTKSYTKKPNGEIESTNFPGVYKCTSDVVEVNTTLEFTEALKDNAAKQKCLLTNSLLRPVVDEPRKKLSDKDEDRSWIILDIDGFNTPDIETFIKTVMPVQFHNVSYIVQHSAGSGIKPGVRAHVFFMLDTPVCSRVIRRWFKAQNLFTEQLRDQITLTNSKQALTYPLDVAASSNGRIVYIAPPECIGFSDPVTERIQHVVKAEDLLSFNFAAVSVEKMNVTFHNLINELRTAENLPKHKAKTFRYEGDKCFIEKSEVQPGAITNYIADNDLFMRCDLNGGDSQAYYYFRNNPKYLHNFKGEPSIPLAALDQHHYDTIAAPWAKKLAEKDVQPFVFRDDASDKYYIGQRKGEEVVRQPALVGSVLKIEHYYAEFGAAPPAEYATWDRVFDPRRLTQWHPEEKVFNTWRPTDVMKNALYRAKAPDTIMHIIRHATGGDVECERFINWLAYVFQNRTKTGTAWILHGCPGTGKGLITQQILPRIFGEDYCATVQVANLKQVYNGWIEQAMFVTVDEANTDDAGQESKAVIEKLKLWITEKRIPLRHMQQTERQVENFSNFIFTSNDFGVLPIQQGDRRFNVGVRQEEPLVVPPSVVNDIKNEIQQFAGYLHGYEVNKEEVHKPFMNEAKRIIMEYKLSSIEEFVRAVQDGDLMWFIDNWDLEDSTVDFDTAKVTTVIKEWIEDVKADTYSVIKPRNLMRVYDAIVSAKARPTIAVFKKNMERHGLGKPGKYSYRGARTGGWKLDWNINEEDLVVLGAHIQAVKTEPKIDNLQKEIDLASPKQQQ